MVIPKVLMRESTLELFTLADKSLSQKQIRDFEQFSSILSFVMPHYCMKAFRLHFMKHY